LPDLASTLASGLVSDLVSDLASDLPSGFGSDFISDLLSDLGRDTDFAGESSAAVPDCGLGAAAWVVWISGESSIIAQF
jgi:hypothetical protein